MAWKMTHPDSDQIIEVEADSVQVYVSQGWETVSGRVPPPVGDVAIPPPDEPEK
jgi:hypothetical protein